MRRKETLRRGLQTLGAYLAVLLFLVPGVLLGLHLRAQGSDWMWIAGCMAALLDVLLVLLMALSDHAAKRLKKKYEMTVREQQEHYLARREDAVRDLPGVTKHLIRLRRRIEAYWGILVTVSLIIAFLCGVCLPMIIFIAMPMFILSVLFGRIPPAASSFDFSEYTDPADYPTLHALAHRAAKATGADGEIRIVLLADGNAGIARIGKTYSLQLGVFLLDILSEEELYQVLLHEFAHKTKDGIDTDREYRLFHVINEQEESVWGNAAMHKIGESAFCYTDTLYTCEYYFYRAAASVAVEAQADLVVIEQGDPQAAANALAKINCFACYDREEETYDFVEPFLLPEEPRQDAASQRCRYFRMALADRECAWRDLFKREIQSRSASHPILRDRIALLGVENYDLTLPTQDGEDAYSVERRRALAWVDNYIYKNLQEDYAERREANYLAPLRTVEAWHAGGEALPAEEARPVIEALIQIGQYDEAFALCQRLLKETDNVFATAYPHMMIGSYLLHHYDPAGITHIYRAVELNKNYIDGSLDLIGEYCCIAGWQEELEKYRERAVELAQEDRDVFSKASELNHDDKLVAEKLPEGMLESILNYMMSVGEDRIERVFLMRKIITDEFFSSVFVVSFLEGTTEETVGQIMHKIFLHLDNRPEDWQFSLFELDLHTSAAVQNVPGCCVYERSKQ